MRIFGICTDWGRPGCDGKYGAVSWYRIINPLEKIGADVQKTAFYVDGPQTALEMKERGDIWVTKPMDSPEVVMQMFVNRDFTGSKIVLDLDDHPFFINKKHPEYQKFVERMPLLKMFIQRADHIICSTEAIKKVIHDVNPKATVIPNAIDPEIWKVTNKKHKNIRIGWVGSASHMADIDIILEPMKTVLRKYQNVEFHMAGMVFEESQEDRVYHHMPTKGYDEYPKYIADLGLDIAVAPLHGTEFDVCKTNIKWLEHSMLETPMVLSDVSPYSDCVVNRKTGFLAKDAKDWVNYLSKLIEDESLRKKIGKSAKKAVEKDWLIEKQLPKYEKLFKKMEKKPIVVYTAISNGFDKLTDCQEDLTAEYVAYTEQESDTWDVRPPYNKMKSGRRNSRIQKIMPHLFFDCEYSIYLDGNIRLAVPAQKLIDEYLRDKDVAVIRHIGRDCIYDEADACIAMGKGKPEEISEQIKDYAKRGWKKHAGLAECGVIIRRHTEEVARMNERWWAHYCRYSERDQLSFPIAFPFEKVHLIEESYWRHPYLTHTPHL